MMANNAIDRDDLSDSTFGMSPNPAGWGEC